MRLILAALPTIVLAGCVSTEARLLPAPPPILPLETVAGLRPAAAGYQPISLAAEGGTLRPNGGVHALVLPVSFGERLPSWNDTTIASSVIGATDGSGTAATVRHESGGQLRLEASVFPYLVSTLVNPERAERNTLDQADVDRLATSVLQAWSGRTNLSAYDNDGPDGIPASGDDDGILDLVVLIVETETVRGIFPTSKAVTVRTGPRDRPVTARPVYVLALRRSADLAEAQRDLTQLVLYAAGLGSPEMFFPAGHEHMLSTIGRVRLGWTGVEWTTRSGEYALRPGHARALPIVDVEDNRAMWLLEQGETEAYITRLARHEAGTWFTTETRILRPGGSETLPLTRARAPGDPQGTVEWSAPSEPVFVRASMTRRLP
jgi:hypothetical protein